MHIQNIRLDVRCISSHFSLVSFIVVGCFCFVVSLHWSIHIFPFWLGLFSLCPVFRNRFASSLTLPAYQTARISFLICKMNFVGDGMIPRDECSYLKLMINCNVQLYYGLLTKSWSSQRNVFPVHVGLDGGVLILFVCISLENFTIPTI